ncbi:MAG: hypothetical protein HYR56_16115 [Acidobacteria bacterium]|nr:hypothetical protein [Acidobacteriota bacterium]MBI3423863.1 hypothetical protein [Acidobacteriota bacterium]
MTIYLFGHLQERFKIKAIHVYIKQHWSAWFPHLPSYQAFNHRRNLLEDVWPVLLGELLSQMELPAKEAVLVPLPGTLFGDKAYPDQATKQALAARTARRFVRQTRKRKVRPSITSAKAGYGRVSFPPCASQSNQSSIGWWRKPAFRMLSRFVPVKACEFTAMEN